MVGVLYLLHNYTITQLHTDISFFQYIASMSKIVAFGNMKGGVGKTTCTILAANAFSQEPFKYKVTVIDTDQQKSIVKLRLMDSEDFSGVIPYDVLNYNVATFESNVKRLDKENDLIFIDVAGKLDKDLPVDYQEATRILNYVDYLFIPFTPGNFSLEATIDYLKFALELSKIRETQGRPFQIIGFSNMHRDRSRNARFLSSEMEQLKNIVNIPFMRNKLNNYTLFADADTIESYYNENSTDSAALNFTVWVNEINKILNDG